MQTLRSPATTTVSNSSTQATRAVAAPRSTAEGNAEAASDFGLVAICVPTFKRPGNLAALLAGLRNMAPDGINVHLVVIDNDAYQSARPVVDHVLGNADIPVTYDVVPEPSLPLVRNRLVQTAIRLGAEWIWFVDDDQLVASNPLSLMLATARKFEADCVVPRVRYLFEGDSSHWARWSGIFAEVPRPTGQPAKAFGSNGPLVRVSALRELEPFDTWLALTGGEDSLFFTRMKDHGFTVVGCDEAVVSDRVHASHSNPGWLTKRALRIGRVKGLMVRHVSPSIARTAKWLVLGMGYTLGNLAAPAVLLLPLAPAFLTRWLPGATIVNASRTLGGIVSHVLDMIKDVTTIRTQLEPPHDLPHLMSRQLEYSTRCSDKFRAGEG